MIAFLIAWVRRVFGFEGAPRREPAQPDLSSIAAKYSEHDVIIARLQDREKRVHRMNEILTHGRPSGNILADVFSGTWPPRHRRRRTAKERS